MKAKGIHLSWIVVKNINAAIKFYTDVVGLQLKEKHDNFGWAEMSGPDGSTLGIAQENLEHDDTKAGSNAVVTITVDDINQARNHLLKNGARLKGDVIDIPGHVKMQTFFDKDNNTLQLVQVLSAKK